MKTFEKSGGRLFRIAGIFTIFCVLVVTVQAVFIKQAMNQVYAISTMEIPEGVTRPEIPQFYSMIIPILNPSNIVTALSAVLIAIAARYGAREVASNMAEGRRYKSQTTIGPDGVSTSEEVTK